MDPRAPPVSSPFFCGCGGGCVYVHARASCMCVCVLYECPVPVEVREGLASPGTGVGAVLCVLRTTWILCESRPCSNH